MNQLANIAKVPYVMSSFSGPTLAAQPVAAQNHMLLLNIGGTDSSLLSKPWLYNDQVMAPHLMPPLAEFSFGEGKRKAAMLSSNDLAEIHARMERAPGVHCVYCFFKHEARYVRQSLEPFGTLAG